MHTPRVLVVCMYPYYSSYELVYTLESSMHNMLSILCILHTRVYYAGCLVLHV